MRRPEVRIRCLPGPVRPENLDYRIEFPQGYLKVYSVSDEFNDGAYYAHSSYTIYSAHGTLVKTVENSISRTDELIPWEVGLPIGSYTVVTRSARVGEVRVHFVIKADQRTIVDLDLAEQDTYRRYFRPVIAWRVQAIRNFQSYENLA